MVETHHTSYSIPFFQKKTGPDQNFVPNIEKSKSNWLKENTFNYLLEHPGPNRGLFQHSLGCINFHTSEPVLKKVNFSSNPWLQLRAFENLLQQSKKQIWVDALGTVDLSNFSQVVTNPTVATEEEQLEGDHSIESKSSEHVDEFTDEHSISLKEHSNDDSQLPTALEQFERSLVCLSHSIYLRLVLQIQLYQMLTLHSLIFSIHH